MSLRQLETFVAIADTGSFSAAADRLFVTQSAVSMQMKALEEEWQVKLFDRKTRPPVLNDNGWRLVEHARKLVRDYRNLVNVALSDEDALVGSMRLGVVPSMTTSILPLMLLELRLQHPGMKIRIEGGLSPELIFKVCEGRLDAAIVTGTERADVRVRMETIRSEQLKVVIHRDLAGGSVKELLSTHPFIRFNPAMGVGRIIESALHEIGVVVDDAMELDSIEAISQMVLMKLGVAIIPEDCIPRHFLPHFLTMPLEPPVSRTVALATHRANSGTPAFGAILTLLRKVAQNPTDIATMMRT